MKNVQALVATLGLAATASATGVMDHGNWGEHGGNGSTSYLTSYTTFTTDFYTTYCPTPTKVTIGTKTYTVTSSQTLTITDCPCTITKPVVPVTTPSGKPTYSANSTMPHNATTTYCPSSTAPVKNQTSMAPPTSYTHITSYYTSTLPPQSSQVVVSGHTYTATTPGGQVTIPVVSASVLPPSPGQSEAPGGSNPPPAESQPAQNSPSPTAPLQVENAAVQQGASLGAFIAGLAALLL